jgi:alkylation response protein AidB-like acyl-CoA dehydrogenase
MDFEPSAEQRELTEQIVRFATKELNAGVAERDRDQVFSRELWRKCAEVGLTGLMVDPAYGGSGLDPLTCALCLEAFGYGCADGGLVFSVGAHLLAVVVPVAKHGSDAQKRRYLPGFCDGTLVAVHGMSEPDSGSDAFAMRMRGEPDGDGWRLNGTKTFASNGPVADVALVFAMTNPEEGHFGGLTGFLVDKGTPGFRVGKPMEKMGLRTSPMSELIFEDCRVGPEAVLGEPGSGSAVFTSAMEWERTLLVAPHVGAMRRLLEQAVKYARTRRQFGQAIGKFQAISHKIADMKVRLEAARLLVLQAASRLDQSRMASFDAAIAKVFASEALVKSALDTVQIFGGYGYATEYDVERTLRDAVGGTLYSGTSEIQRNIIARWLGL